MNRIPDNISNLLADKLDSATELTDKLATIVKSHRPAASPVAKKLAVAGAALGVTALLVSLAAMRAEKRHPATGKFMEVDGVRLHYLEEGFGAPIILLHGNGAMATDFKASGVFDALAAKNRVIAFDRPGFGYSDRPRGRNWSASDQAALLVKAFKRLGVSRPLVVGHSWGTLTALALALDHPAQVGGLVLLGGYYYPTFRPDALMMAGPAIPVLGDVMRYTVSPVLGKALVGPLVKKLFAPAEVPDKFFEAVPQSLMLRPGQLKASAAESLLMMTDAEQLSGRYKALQLPITIIAGKNDAIIDQQEQSARLHGELPQSELSLLDDVGHMLHYAETARVVEAIEKTLGKSGTPMPSFVNHEVAVNKPASLH
jgi:pimeloyl-ACP methyl ester carboxylesterase